MNRGDLKILKTASNQCNKQSPLAISKAINNLQLWQDNHAHSDFIKSKCNKLTKLIEESKIAFDNLDRKKLYKIASNISLELDCIRASLSEFNINKENSFLKIVKRACYRELLPESNFVIRPKTGSLDERIRFLRILSSALRTELDADCCSIHCKNDLVELQSDIPGSSSNVRTAIAVIADGIYEAFKLSTGFDINYDIIKGESNFDLLDHNKSEKLFRKFAFKVWS
jgi:hypothetical protein